MADNDRLLPVTLLIDDLQSDDVYTKVGSIKKLTTISLALGPERTRGELIPYLTETCNSDEDEVLMILAEQLGLFLPLVGGAEFGSCLLPPLELLAAAEETVIREKSVQSLCQLAGGLTTSDMEKQFWPLIKRLSQGEWFHSRTSACGLFTALYSHITTSALKIEVRNLFKQLAADDTPMVRRAVATNLGEFAGVLEQDVVRTDFIHVLLKLLHDDQDSVRALATESSLAFIRVLTKDDIKKYIVPILKMFIEDKSWRLRFAIAEKICLLQAALPADIVLTILLNIYVSLLKDVENEVRAEAINKIQKFSAALPSGQRQTIIMQQFMPIIKEMCKETNLSVKTNLANVMMGLAPMIGKDNTIEHLLPLFLLHLHDENSEVRLNVINNLHNLNQVITLKQLSNILLPPLLELSEDAKWRIRLAVIDLMPMLSNQLGQQTFDDKLNPLCIKRLEDPVFAVREAVVINYRYLMEKFGHDWTANNLFPKVVHMSRSSNYLHRLIFLSLMQNMITVCSSNEILKIILPASLPLSQDPVPNVRFKVAQTMSIAGGKIDQNSVVQLFKGPLQKLVTDKDGDVIFYAKEAIGKLKLSV